MNRQRWRVTPSAPTRPTALGVIVNQRWSTAATVLGAAILAADGLFGYLKLELQLKLTDLTSGNPRWVRPVPTRFDEFVLGVPVDALLIIGVALLTVGYLAKRR